jgi:hypothetical protein
LSRKLVLIGFISALILTSALEMQHNILISAYSTTAQERWAIIEDINGDSLRIETVSDEVWNELVQLYQNGSERWIGGIVESYGNQWGFRFDPKTIIIAEVTIEMWQTTIQGISENLSYWLGKTAVVSARVVQIHVSQSVGGIAIPANKFALLAPHIGFSFVILCISVAVILCIKRKRRREDMSQPLRVISKMILTR